MTIFTKRFACAALPIATMVSAIAACSQAPSDSSTKIIGGHLVRADSPAATSTVSLIQRGARRAFCTGTLIAENLVVTAAHCVEQFRARDFNVGFGNYTHAVGAQGPDTVTVGVSELKTFKNSGSAHLPNFDIAWVKLASRAPDGAKPIEILRDARTLSPGEPITIAGFGITSTGCNDADPNCGGTKLEANTVYHDYLNQGRLFSLLRLGPTPGFGACSGDSGGPAYVQKNGRWYLIGATSGAYSYLTPEAFASDASSCEPGSGVFTFVGDYARWISETSQTALAFDEKENPPGVERVLASREERPSSFSEWLAYDNHEDPAWETVEMIVEMTLKKQRGIVVVADLAPTLLAPEQILEASRKRSDYSFSSIRPPIRDLSPLASMDWISEVSLTNSRVADFSPLSKLPALTKIRISSNFLFSSEIAHAISFVEADDYANLTSLYVTGAPGVVDLKNSADRPAFKLKELSLNGLSLKDQDVAAFPWEKFSLLEKIELSGDEMKMKSMAAIRPAQPSALKSIRIFGTSIESFAGFDNPTLEELEINPGIERWAQRGSLKSLEGIGALPNLRTLRLWKQSLTDVAPLAKITSLETLDIYNNFIADISSLSTLHKLQKLSAWENKLSSKECPVSPATICVLEE